MQLPNSFIPIIFNNILKLGSLTTLAPVYIKFYNTSNADITNTLFGIDRYIITTDKFNASTIKEISNNTALNIGTSLIEYINTLTLKLFTVTDLEVFSYSYAANLNVGTVYTLSAGSLKITLPNLNTNLANFLLNYIFRNVTTGKPTAWYLELQDTSNVAYQSRVLLDVSKFSETFINELGHHCVSCIDYLNIVTSSNKRLKNAKLFTGTSGGTSWFDFSNILSYNVYSGRTLELFNNSLIVSIKPSDLAVDFKLNSNPSVIFWCDYNGTAKDYALDKLPTLSTFTYTTSNNLYKSECAIANSLGRAVYPNMVLAEDFVLDFIIKFDTSPSGRYIWFLEIPGAFLLGYALTNIIVNNEFGSVVDTAWSPVINTWYHICIYKLGTGVWVYANDTLLSYVVYGGGRYFGVSATPSPLNVNNTTYPILGHINHLSICTDWKPLTPLVEPSPKNAYNWNYVSSNVWRNMTFTQWLQYCK